MLAELERDVRTSLNNAEEKARSVGAHMVMVGILPTVTDHHLNARLASAPTRATSCSTSRSSPRAARTSTSASRASSGSRRSPTRSRPRPRARACSCTCRSTRGRSARTGTPRRRSPACSSRSAANSPFFFGKELWRETRIPLFEQATDTRPEELRAQGVRPRVWFGERWITSIFDLFEENVRYFPALLPVCEDEDPVEVLARGDIPRLQELRLHNGTIYRWNRPIYDVVRGRPHLRVENRVLPAGPTVVDILANAAFYYGLIRMLVEEDRPIWSQMSFSARGGELPRRRARRDRRERVLAGRGRGPGHRARAAAAAADGPRGPRRAGAWTPPTATACSA